MKTLIAHRGMSSLAPENTLSAFALCKAHSIQWIECDLNILKDGTIVVSHDESLDRCTDKSGSFYDITYSDLAAIDAGSWFSDAYTNERIPTIQQLVSFANTNNINFNLELKAFSADEARLDRFITDLMIALKPLDTERALIVSSFNHQLLAKFKRLRPETETACLFESAEALDHWQESIEHCQASYIHPADKGLTQERVQAFKKAGLKVNVWTVNNLARANELFNWGVDGICTDIAQHYPAKYKQP